MVLVEIALQGVRGFPAAGASLRLRAGYNVVSAGGAALRGVLEALLDPAAADEERLRGRSGATRAGVTFVAGDGQTYRVVRELGAGCALQRLDPQQKAFVAVAGELPGVLQALRAAGVPDRRRLALLAISSDELPSRRAAGRAIPGPAAPARATHVAYDPELEARFLGAEAGAPVDAEEETPLGTAGGVAAEAPVVASRLQEASAARLDELQRRLFRLEELLQERARLSERVAVAEAALAELGQRPAAVDALAVDGAVSAADRAAARRDEALAAVPEKEALASEPPEPPRPFWAGPAFWAGIGVGVAAAALGAWSEGSPARYVALLDLPAFGWAAWTALRWVSAVERHDRVGRRRALVAEHERKVLEAYDREVAPLQHAMAALAVATREELEDLVRRVAAARDAAAAARAALEALDARPEAVDAAAEREALEREIAQAELAASGEAARLAAARTAASPASPAAPPPRGAAMGAAGGHAPSTAPPAAAWGGAEEALAELLSSAARELPWNPQLALAVQGQASQALAALSAGRLRALVFEERKVAVVGAGGRAPVTTLPLPEQDLAWLALKLAVAERLVAAGAGPALVDDALDAVPPAVRPVAARLLKAAARRGQLLHATAEACFREAADHVA